MIPKIIHDCWFGQSEKPALVRKCMESWREVLPDWEFVEWNESNSPLSVPYVRNALKAQRYAFAADYVRFHALQTIGGVYLDTDMELLKDLSPLLNDKFFIGRESEDFINAAIIGSEKGERIVTLILDELKSRAGKSFESIPVIITDVLNKNGGVYSNEVIYDTDYFYPFNPFDNKRNEIKQLFYRDITENTYAIHHWQQSWQYTLIERVINRFKAFIK